MKLCCFCGGTTDEGKKNCSFCGRVVDANAVAATNRKSPLAEEESLTHCNLSSIMMTDATSNPKAEEDNKDSLTHCNLSSIVMTDAISNPKAEEDDKEFCFLCQRTCTVHIDRKEGDIICLECGAVLEAHIVIDDGSHVAAQTEFSDSEAEEEFANLVKDYHAQFLADEDSESNSSEESSDGNYDVEEEEDTDED